MEKNSSSRTGKEGTGHEREEFKTSLGPIASRYSDAQLIQLRSDMSAAARLLLDLYLLKKEAKRKGWNIFDSRQMEP